MTKKINTKGTADRKMKIGQLAKDCGLNKSTIHHYLNIGLLHKPQRTGSTSALYDESHFRRLKKITKLRKENKLPLAKIKEILKGPVTVTDEGKKEVEFQKRVFTAHQSEIASKEAELNEKKNQIMDAAMRLFNVKGYENTTIKDIMDSIDKANSTFYLYFESKEELFKECMNRMTLIAVPREKWEQIKKERYYPKRAFKRSMAWFEAFPSYGGVLNQVFYALTEHNSALAETARETLRDMTRPLAKDIQMGIADGTLREVDIEKISYMLLGIGEMTGYFLSLNPQCKVEEVNAVMQDFILYGLINRDDKKNVKCKPSPKSDKIKNKKKGETE